MIIELLQVAVFTEYLLALLSSGFNAAYFGTFRTSRQSQRVGAAVLTVVSLGTLLQSGYGGLALLLYREPFLPDILASSMAAVVIQGVVTLGSVAVTGLVGRRVLATLRDR